MKKYRVMVLTATLAVAIQAHANLALRSMSITLPMDMMNTPHPLNLSVGIGSGAYHRSGDPDDVIYTISDRGPNIPCEEAKALIGRPVCPNGKIFPNPYFAPSIYKLKITASGVEVLARIQIKTAQQIPVTGISTPKTEAAFDLNGKKLRDDPNGVDSEALVRTQSGDFYVGDEYGPSILHLARDGTILARWIPKGSKARFAGADYPLREKLPAILAKRHLNRGIESVGLSPDEQFLYFSLQSPLDNPNKDAYKKSRNVRLFKLKRTSGDILGEYVYQLDKPSTFAKDNHKKPRKQSDVKISEMTAIGQDKLIILERISQTTKFYQVDLSTTKSITSKWDNAATHPSLEQQMGVPMLRKTLVFSTDEVVNAPSKIEGMAYVNPKLWYLSTDNDFGIDGQASHIVKVTF
ncbi:esterase-like activity of phytase family protein [Celerinatantimonas yamalensis]|uniref:Esterase-like activity of phytase family protein n=1 Tax=Celerinatantimonas yamalensis TaxID=559956 RepID=A0ABW9GA99_9GAMM